MATHINKEGKLIIETNQRKSPEDWLEYRRSLIIGLQTQSNDFADDDRTRFHLLELLLDTEPTLEQAKKMFVSDTE